MINLIFNVIDIIVKLLFCVTHNILYFTSLYQYKSFTSFIILTVADYEYLL